MLYRVVRPFPLSLDGLTLISLVEGDERSEWGGMEDGLAAEGYIEPVGEPPVIEIVAESVSAEADARPTAPKPEQRRRRGR
jgi:hypothetical protein